MFATVVSVYAPIHQAAQEKKEEFYADLQAVVDVVEMDEILLMVGDFNARVGSSERQVDARGGVRGCWEDE